MSLLTLVVTALLAGVPCEHPGEWPHTRDAVWLEHVVHRAGYERDGCTGSAFVIHVERQDLYVWAFTSRLNRFPQMRTVHIAGAAVHVERRLRAVWRARRRVVWVEAGPTSGSLPKLSKLAPLVRASLRVR